ncbi:MAG TPA: peptidase M3, partial [Cryomorphaceae bacterium]|nr:peptidase M3 [Cryomorphaceae bacterium]
MNPMIDFPQTPFGSLAFDKIEPAHFIPAAEHWMDVARGRIANITANDEVPTFSNTIVALEFASKELSIVSSCFFNLNSAETNEDIQSVARELSPKLTLFNNETLLNEALFFRIKWVWKNRDKEQIDSESQRLLKETYEGFVRNGALLEGEERETLKSISEKLSKLSLSFGENVLKETQAFEHYVEEAEDLAGLPEAVVSSAAALAKEKGKQGYIFGLDMPTYISIMKYADKASLRELMYCAYGTRAAKENELNNEKNIQDLVNTRLAKAQLLGFSSHAALTLSKRMAKTPERVLSFLDDLKALAKPAAEKDLKAVQEFASAAGHQGEVKPWDFSYWSEKLKKATLNLDDNLLKPYFKIENV